MSDYTAEQFAQLPEFAKADFVEVDGVYRHAGFVKVKKTADDLDTKYRASNEKISAIESSKAAEIEAAKNAALELARSKGDVTAIEKRYQEQLADIERRNGETAKQQEERLNKLLSTTKAKSIDSIVAELAADATDDGREAYKRLIRQRIDYDAENGQYTFLDDAGSATALDLKGFRAESAKEAMFKPLLKAAHRVDGGGHANGSSFAGSAQQKSNLSPTERLTRAREAQR